MAEFKSTISSQDFDKALQGGLDYAADKSGIWEALENAGGLTDTEKAFMLTLFKNAAYTADVSATIDQLEALWSGSEEPDEPIEPDDPDIPVVNTYTVTNALTNVTNSNAAASVTEGASYTATLTADEGYNIDSVTVTVGGVDVTASVYANGVVSISNVSGNIVITATAVASGGGGDGRTPLYNWDFTKSLIDTVQGFEMTLSDTGATQDANGLTISAAGGYAMAQILDNNMTVELDIVSYVRSGTGHARVLTYGGTSNSNDKGFIYRSTGKWAWYGNGWTESSLTATDALNGKMVSVFFGETTGDASSQSCPIVVKVDGVELLTQNSQVLNHTGLDRLCIGSKNGLSAYTLVVSGLRVYEGV